MNPSDVYYEQGGLEILRLHCLSDNYGYLIRDSASGSVACVDTPDVDVITRALEKHDWSLDYILNTHHHWDHTGGNCELKMKTNAKIIGPAAESDQIPGIDIQVSEGDFFELGQSKAKVFDTPGHTLGHIVYIFEKAGVAFVGDTLFSLGCGRLFEGSPSQMWNSLCKLKGWPGETLIYCAHEYTEANLAFANSLNQKSEALEKRGKEILSKRAANLPTVPFTLEEEFDTNPFLRADEPSLADALNMSGYDPVDIFTTVRRRKDTF